MAKRRAILNHLSEVQQAYVDHIAKDFRFFCENDLWVVDKKGRQVAFKWNEAQELLWAEIQGGRSRLAILKARQMGMSTFIAAYFFWCVLTQRNKRCMVIAHDHEAAAEIFRIYQNYYDNLDEWLQDYYPLKHSTKTELVFKKHTGYIRIATSKSVHKMRSKTLHYMHCSEVAFWPDMQTLFTAALQALTDRGLCFVETTANSFNYFYTWWNDKKGYKKIFLPWFELSSYRIHKESGGLYTDAERVPFNFDEELVEVLERELTEDETKYVNQYKLDEDQVRWMKWAVNQKCEDDWRGFSQEYPCSENSAFLHSGDQFFPGIYIPSEITSPFEIIEKPIKGCVYCIGADVATGSVNGDYSAMVVMNMTAKPRKIVAWSYQRHPIHEFADRIIKFGKDYFNALVVHDAIGPGAALTEHLSIREYPRVFKRFIHDKIANKYVEKLGFRTDGDNRFIILDRLRLHIESGLIDEKLPVPLVNEMAGFTYNEKGRPDHAPGCFSDFIMGTALALEGEGQLEGDVQAVFREHMPQTAQEIMDFEDHTGLIWEREMGYNQELDSDPAISHLVSDGLEL